jgi:hypothetical protein
MSVDARAGAPMPDAVAGSPEGGLRNRTLTIVAQDPGVRYRRRIVTGTLYQPAELPAGEATAPSDARILGDRAGPPDLHEQHCLHLECRQRGRRAGRFLTRANRGGAG